jgi:hypothetical protein
VPVSVVIARSGEAAPGDESGESCEEQIDGPLFVFFPTGATGRILRMTDWDALAQAGETAAGRGHLTFAE